MNMSSALRKVASADDLHRELVVDVVVVLQKGNQLGLDDVDGVVCGVIGQPMEVDVQRCLADDSHQQQILQIIRNAPLQSTVEMQLHSLIIGDHSCIKLQERASLGDHDLASVGHRLHQLQESRLLGLEAGRVAIEIDVLQDDVLLCHECTEDVLSEVAWVFLDQHRMLIYLYSQEQLRVSRLDWNFAVAIDHLPAADHQSYLVDIHDLFLDLAAVFHLGDLLEVAGCLDVLRACRRVNDGKCSDCALHPDGHGLQSNQLPVVQVLDPICELFVDLAFRRIERR